MSAFSCHIIPICFLEDTFSKVVRQELGAGDKQGGSGRWCWDEKVAGSCHVRESATSLDSSGASAIRNPVWAGRR